MFYDLIGRFIPGLLILSLAAWIYWPYCHFVVPTIESLGGIVGGALLVVLSYTLCFLLTPFAAIFYLIDFAWQRGAINRIYPHFISSYAGENGAQQLQMTWDTNVASFVRVKDFLFDETISRGSERHKRLLPKMLAEIRLCANLSLGCTAIWIVTFIERPIHWTAFHSLGVWGCAILSALATTYFSWRTFLRYCTFLGAPKHSRRSIGILEWLESL